VIRGSLILSALLSTSASAHSVPQTLEVIGWIGDDPVALIHSYGVIARPSVADPWRFLCPSAWGGPEVTEAIMTDDQVLVIATQTGIQRFGLDGRPIGGVMPGFSAYDAPILVKGDGGLFALLYDGGGSRIVRVDDTGVAPIFETPILRTGIAAFGGRIHLGTSSSSEALFEILEEDGRSVETFRYGSEVRWVTMGVANGDVVAGIHRTRGAELVRVGPPIATMFETEDQLVGVVGLEGRFAVLIGDRLSILDGMELVGVSERRVTGIGDGPPGPFAFFYSTVQRFDANGQLGEVLFELPSIREPSYDGMEARVALTCRAEWIDLQSEGGLLKPTPPPVMPPPPPPMERGGCGCAATGGAPTLLVWLLGLVLVRRQ
jgi:MYXO-CTERM domain-containing protein